MSREWTEQRDQGLQNTLDRADSAPTGRDPAGAVVLPTETVRDLRTALVEARAELARLKGTGATRGLAQLVGRERLAVMALRDLCEAQGLTLTARIRFHPLEPMVRNLSASAEDDGTLHVWLDGPYDASGLGEARRG